MVMDPLEIVGNKKEPFIKKTVENRTDKYETSLNNAKDALRLWNDTVLECADPVPASEGMPTCLCVRRADSSRLYQLRVDRFNGMFALAFWDRKERTYAPFYS